eukprot:TRINITY_DN24292_c0_g1_i1.p1 TRINITY_DN24292_c0_g1~~TRINITY_DN24292_c0_g1_i1.p1  ORF type:complete len:154 (-),score=17.91 TRINITY_DN24292_c0_g1_i1:58-519(-)
MSEGQLSLCTVYLKMFIRDILQLSISSIADDSFDYFGKPITNIELMGIVLSKESKGEYTNIIVDDGSGTIQCAFWHQTNNLISSKKRALKRIDIIKIGDLIRIQGKINQFRNTKHINIFKWVVEEDDSAELLHWLQTIHFTDKVYSVPFCDKT